NLLVLNGKVLRIDPRHGSPYAVPAGNPFSGSPPDRPEIWAYGLRNPWRFAFDAPTGDLVLADVGENVREEINRLPAGSGAGANFGWNTCEGDRIYPGNGACPLSGAPYVPPALAYGH